MNDGAEFFQNLGVVDCQEALSFGVANQPDEIARRDRDVQHVVVAPVEPPSFPRGHGADQYNHI